MHFNLGIIEKLYGALRAHDAEAATACYAPNAHFEDIAFKLEGREDIRTMWRIVCDPNTELEVLEFRAHSADDERGRGHWKARYKFNKTDDRPGRVVVNRIDSEFIFRRGEIVRQDDRCDPLTWAEQAYPAPLAQVVGRSKFLRRLGARLKLRKFLKQHPKPSVDSD